MGLSDAVNAVVAVLRRRPADILPWYVLGAAVPAIVRVVPFLAIVLGVVYLEATGRLATMLDHLEGIDAAPPDPDADAEAVEEWVTGFEPVFEQLFTLPMTVLVVLTIVVSILLAVLLYAIVAAGQLTACDGRLRDRRGLVAGIAGVRRFWLRFLGLYLLEFVLWLAVILPIAFGTALLAGATVAVTGSVLPAVLLGLVATLVLVAAVAVIRALFAFAPVAVVVDDATILGSLSNTVGFVRARPIGAGFYYLVSVGTLLAVSTVSGVLLLVDVAAFVSLVTAILVFPALDLLKTALYSDYRGRMAPPVVPDRPLRAQFRDGLRRGWDEMIAFVRSTPGTHALVVVLAVGSFWVGWEAGEPLVGPVETSISARLEGHLPPAAALEFFGNNWLVALTTAFAGLALVVPAVVSLLFNGVFMGVYARTEVEPLELLAFVIPHGVLEIPAILVASALGIWLGVVGWRAFRGRTSRTAFADALERAFWVLVGVGILLAVAAVVEGFVSPYYFRPFL